MAVVNLAIPISILPCRIPPVRRIIEKRGGRSSCYLVVNVAILHARSRNRE